MSMADNMVFTKTAIGKNHIRGNIVCQDFSDSYRDGERCIVTACDGHGGAIYIRSDRGAAFASAAFITVMKRLPFRMFYRNCSDNLVSQLRVQILCEWNGLVERDLAEHPITDGEIADLAEEDRFRLQTDPITAYGTTLIGAALFRKKLICASLGDGGCFLYRKGILYPAFPEDDEQVANLTYSMCQSDAGRHLQIGIFEAKPYDGVLLCSDGVINPYRTFENFSASLAIPAAADLIAGKTDELSAFVVDLGARLGIGDDVTLSLILRPVAVRRYGNEDRDDEPDESDGNDEIDETAEIYEVNAE